MKLAVWIAGLVLVLVVTGSPQAAPVAYWEATVMEVQTRHPERDSEFVAQEVVVELRRGPMKGQKLKLSNFYREDLPDLFLLQEGSRVIVGGFVDQGVVVEPFLQDISRQEGLYLLFLLFCSLLLVVGGLRGVKTLITLLLTVAAIGLYLLPRLLAGGDPIRLSIITAVGILSTTFILVGGGNRKSLAAFIGTVCGIAVSGAVAIWVGELSHLTGVDSEEARLLSRMGTDMNIQGLLFAGIILGSLGAVTDVGMSVASAAAELKAASSYLGMGRIAIASLRVGRDIMGTMANTLILAYAGAALPLLLVTLHVEDSWLRLVNSNLVATEILRGMAGSIGLIVTIPITVVASAVLLRDR